MKHKQILLINGYSWYNKGDAGITIATLIALRKLYLTAKLDLTSFTPDVDTVRYAEFGVSVVKPFFLDKFLSSSNRLFKLSSIAKDLVSCIIFFAFYQMGLEVRALLSPKTYDLITKYCRADLVISLGGGFLNDNFGEAFLLHLYQIIVAILLDRPVFICAQSIGPFKSKLNRFAIRIILNKVDLITVRECFSKEFLSEIGVRTRTYLTADMAFLLDAPMHILDKNVVSDEKFLKESNLFIGITVREWVYPHVSNSLDSYNNYINVFSRFIDYLAEKKNVVSFLIPQVIGPGLDDDRLTAARIFMKVKNKNKVFLLNQDYSPYEIMQLIRKMNLFVGTRMHSNIFSMIVNTPALAISYEYKTIGIMSQLGLIDSVIPIEELNFDTLVIKTEKNLFELDKCRCELKDKIAAVKKSAEINVKLIDTLIRLKSKSIR